MIFGQKRRQIQKPIWLGNTPQLRSAGHLFRGWTMQKNHWAVLAMGLASCTTTTFGLDHASDEVAFHAFSNKPTVAIVSGLCCSSRPVGDDDTDCDVDLSDFHLLSSTLDLTGYSVFQLNYTGPQSAVLPCSNLCGNAIVEINEECDPPDGLTCDHNCRITSDSLPANNSCAHPTPVGEGSYVFNTLGASSDGPDEPGSCVIQGYTQVDSDLWWCFQPTHTESVVVSLCGSAFDTKMMIYDGCSCPLGRPLACSDDDCGTGTDSRASAHMIAGNSYLIRIGGYEGEKGVGRLTIFGARNPYRGDQACNEFSGDCFAAHSLPGCDDTTPCTATCAVDQFCCDVEWDSICTVKAFGITNGFGTCGAPGAGSCFIANPGTPGCDDPGCCQTICAADPYCCLTEWDEVCAGEVGNSCGLFAACSNTTASCFAVHAGPGCSLTGCCNLICQNDPFCCESNWDDVCVDQAATLRQSGMCLP